MGYWTTELVRLDDGRLIEATIPSKMDRAVLAALTSRIGTLEIPPCKLLDGWPEAMLLPAACGSKLFLRLANDPVKGQNEPTSEVEALAISSLSGFRRAIGLRISNSGIADICKVASCFETNAYRTKTVAMRKNQVYVDRINGATSYVPPPSSKIQALIKDLYGLVSNRADGQAASLALAFYGMCHFIAIHPLSDGNGRSGRALFLRLCARGGISNRASAMLIALLHVKHANLFYPALMKYCLSGDLHMLEDLLVLSISETTNYAHPCSPSPDIVNSSSSRLPCADYSQVMKLRAELGLSLDSCG